MQLVLPSFAGLLTAQIRFKATPPPHRYWHSLKLSCSVGLLSASNLDASSGPNVAQVFKTAVTLLSRRRDAL